MLILKKIVDFARKNKLLLASVVAVVVMILILNMYRNQAQKYEKKLEVAEQNLLASQDELRTTRDKKDKEQYEKLAYLTNSVKNLEQINKDLADEVRSIKGNVNTIIKTDLKIERDTIEVPIKAIYNDSVFKFNMNLSENYGNQNYRILAIEGRYDTETDKASASINKDEIGISLVTGIKDVDKGTPKIFIKSDYPGFKVTSLQGAELDPSLFKKKEKQKKLSVGTHIGYAPLYYNLTDKKFGFANQFVISAGINYKIF